MIPLADSYFSDMPQIAKQFLNYLGTIKGRSVRTVDGYHIDLRTFLRFMKLYKSGIKLSGIRLLTAKCHAKYLICGDLFVRALRSVKRRISSN